MRKALLVGIDYYENVSSLHGCVNDSYNVKSAIERNSDGTKNFEVRHLIGTGADDLVSRLSLWEHIRDLFLGDGEIDLLYFAGHGHIESTGGYILASDAKAGNEGVPLSEVITFANQSKAKNRVVILDSCHSGIAGNSALAASVAEIKEGTTIMTASTAEQYASEENGSGVFTTLFVDALHGAAANLLGEVTPGSVYAHVDQSLGSWDQQRPVFKTNVKKFVSLKKVKPPISLEDLMRITEFFPNAGFEFPLDPTFEPERSPSDSSLPKPDQENNAKFAILQKYNRVNLVIPVSAPHMWHAAMSSTPCKLTVLGEHYRRLVESGRI